jgi:hypothetical protein
VRGSALGIFVEHENLRDRASRAPDGLERDLKVKCLWCERPRFNGTSEYCWFHARALANLQERPIVEIANCSYESAYSWGEIELCNRVLAVYPKMADRLATLLDNLDNLSVTEGRQFVNALFSPTEAEFLRSRAGEIWAALGTPA